MQNNVKNSNCIVIYAVNFDKGAYSHQQVIKAFSDQEDLDLNTKTQFNAAEFLYQAVYLHEYAEKPHNKTKFAITSSCIRGVKNYLKFKCKTISNEDVTAIKKLIKSIEVYLTLDSSVLLIKYW